MKIQKKHLIAGAIGAVTITGALVYLQYKRLMNYVIKLKKISIKKIGINNVDLNLYLDFENKSDLGFTIEEQIHNIYINDKFVSKIENKSPNYISPKTSSTIGVNINFNPSKVLNILGKSLTDFVTAPEKIKLKIDIKLKVKLWFFTINIPFLYETNFKELLNSEKEK
jgi:LEA14-like dessication related protein